LDLSFFRAGDPARAPVLLLHGAGGRPGDFQDFADDLARSGIPSLCPLLPGNGLGDDALRTIRFRALAERSLEAFDLLAREVAPPAIVGQSVGAVLGIHAAIERPVPRLAALAPALQPYVARRVGRVLGLALFRPADAFRAWRWQADVRRGITTTTGRLRQLQCPLLILHSTDDDSVSVHGSRDLLARAGSSSKRLVLLEGQGHVLTIAPDRARVVAEVLRFLTG
jgi:carboxylesterase